MKKIAFPHIGNYHIPAKYLFKHIVNAKVIDAPKISNQTVELGNKYSPEFVCMPFKYTIGTLIECLDKGADTLIQLGGGCRYGYYSELQDQILKDLNYKFTFINLVTCGNTDYKKIFKDLKTIDPKFNIIKGLYYFFVTSKMVRYMDRIDNYIRRNIGFEIEKNSFANLNNEMLKKFSQTKGLLHLKYLYYKYKRKFKKLKTNKPKKPLKVGIIGELYTVMEPFSNYFLEQTLASFNIEIERFTNAEYLLFKKSKKIKKYLKDIKKYVTYKMGADAADNIGRCKYLCKKKYDGIIHIKSSFCTPEIGAMPILTKVCNDHNIPIIYFSFDANTSELGIKTRLEAFNDMLQMRRKNE